MTPGAKMMMMRSNRKRDYGMRNSMNYPMTDNYGVRNEMENRYDMDSRFRDRRGREHYDNGRFAPRNEWEAYIVGDNMENRMEPRQNNYPMENRRMENNHPMENRRNDYPRGTRMNQIGFNTGTEMRSDYKTRVDAPVWNEGASMKGGEMQRGHASSKTFDEGTAHEWMENLKNADGTTGPHFSKEQVKGMMNQKSVQMDPMELWIAMNMLYSDYCKVAKKLNVNNVNFYMDMACAFLEDEDAVDDKLAAYYECIVKHG